MLLSCYYDDTKYISVTKEHLSFFRTVCPFMIYAFG